MALEDKQNATNIADVDRYDFMDHAVKGTGGFRDGKYIVPHVREYFYLERCKNAYYPNYVRPIIRALTKPVFQAHVARLVKSESGEGEPNAPLFGQFLLNCDNAGTSLPDWMKATMPLSVRYGVVFIVMDNFPKELQPSTLKAALEQRVGPYVYRKKPQEVYDFSVNKWGVLTSITFTEKPDEVSKAQVEGTKKTTLQYRRWTAREWILYEKDEKDNKLKVVNRGRHGLGVIPVLPVYMAERDSLTEVLPEPPFYDLARVNAAIFNIESEGREQQRGQGFALLSVQADDAGDVSVGVHNALVYKSNVQNPPEFIAPPSDVADIYIKKSSQLREEIYRMAELQGVNAVKESKSGVSREFDFIATETALNEVARLSESVEQWLAAIHQLYSKERFLYEVNYPKEFAKPDPIAPLERADKAILLNVGPKFNLEVKKQVAKEYFPEKPKEEMEEILADIEQHAEDEAHANAADKDKGGEGGAAGDKEPEDAGAGGEE